MRTTSPPESSDKGSPNNYQSITGNDKVSLIELKSLANRMLPRDSVLRTLLSSEPDFLPRSEAMIKIEIYVRLLYKEIGQRGV
ncbi:MAG: hypothetical protein ABSB40_05005 [Nitrososphaeria archaeon]|jgi:hypothetical protein